MEMTKYECERGHYFDVPCVDSLSGTPHYTCPKCGSEECRRVVFPGLIDQPITITDELAREFLSWEPGVCNRLAETIKRQFEQRKDNG